MKNHKGRQRTTEAKEKAMQVKRFCYVKQRTAHAQAQL